MIHIHILPSAVSHSKSIEELDPVPVWNLLPPFNIGGDCWNCVNSLILWACVFLMVAERTSWFVCQYWFLIAPSFLQEVCIDQYEPVLTLLTNCKNINIVNGTINIKTKMENSQVFNTTSCIWNPNLITLCKDSLGHADQAPLGQFLPQCGWIVVGLYVIENLFLKNNTLKILAFTHRGK